MPEVVEANESIVVESSSVVEAREAVAREIQALGYVKARDKGDHIVFLNEDPWKPRVILWDSGYVEFAHQEPRFHPPGSKFASEGNYAYVPLCIVLPTACLSAGSRVVNPAKIDPQKDIVLDAIADEMAAYERAVVEASMRERLEVELPAECAAIWEGEGTAAERRRRLFELWDSRTETPEGEAARDVVESYIRGVVQSTPDAFTAEEIAALNATRTVERDFLAP